MEAAGSSSSFMTMSKPCPSQESGWSIYIDDFLLSSDNKEAEEDTAPTTITTTSSSSSVMLNRKRKRKAREDPLEDTASSSSSSHKDASGVLGMNPRKKDKKGNSAKSMELKMEGVAELGPTGCNELRKRGLYLVPVSSLLHYLG